MPDDVRATIDRLERELAELKASVAQEHAERPTTRRAMLRTVAAGAAGAAVAGVSGLAGVRPAAALDPNDLDLTAAPTTNDHTAVTGANYVGTTTAFAFSVESGPTAANNATIINGVTENGGTAFLGLANTGGPERVGAIGWSKQPAGIGLIGFTGGAGKYGAEIFGGQADLRLRPGQPAPIAGTPVPHDAGELFEDETNTLWLSVAPGTPGEWRVVAGPLTAGAFHAISPQRVLDTRNAGGKLQPNVERVVSVANTEAGGEVLPPGALAVALTCTVTNTEGGGGFVSVRPEGTAFANTSSINWFGPDQNIGTTVISALGGDRSLILRAGNAATDFVIDVTGFYR